MPPSLTAETTALVADRTVAINLRAWLVNDAEVDDVLLRDFRAVKDWVFEVEEEVVRFFSVWRASDTLLAAVAESVFRTTLMPATTGAVLLDDESVFWTVRKLLDAEP